MSVCREGRLFSGLEFVGDVVNEAFHFLAVELDAALADSFGNFFARVRTLFRSKKDTTGCSYGSTAQECG